MRTTIFTIVLVAVCCFSFTREVRAEEGTTIYGSSSTEYDEATNTVTVYATSELDYMASEFYMASVSSSTTDPRTGTQLGSGGTVDYSGSGYAGAYYQFYAGYEDQEFQTRSSHLTFFNLQQPNGLYIDRWSFLPRYDSEGAFVGYKLVPYFSDGSRYDTSRSMTRLGMSASASVALTMPQDYVPGRAAWNNLTPAEKRFVKRHPIAASDFHLASTIATDEEGRRFQDSRDGTQANAFKHAYWNALMVKYQGAALAEEFGNAHEARPDDQRFTNMDLHNNAVGRQIAVDNPNASADQLANLVIQALNGGRLQVICPSICR